MKCFNIVSYITLKEGQLRMTYKGIWGGSHRSVLWGTFPTADGGNEKLLQTILFEAKLPTNCWTLRWNI